jgi:hypothetical protein
MLVCVSLVGFRVMPCTQPVAWFSRTETLVVGRFQVVKTLIFLLKKAFARLDEQ